MEGVNMRKYYVTYREYTRWGDYEFDNIVITLNEGEKANLSTFEDKLKEEFLDNYKQTMSWSLIEE